jgi:hypothetical protein
MATHEEFLRKELGTEEIKAMATGLAFAVAVTPTQVVTGRTGLLGRWGGKVERYDLARLSGIHVAPNPSATMLRIEFSGKTVMVLYDLSASPGFEKMIPMLQERAQANSRGLTG